MQERKKPTALEKAILGFVCQAPFLIPFIDVIDNIAILPMPAGESIGSARKKAREILEVLDVAHRATAMPSRHSGGSIISVLAAPMKSKGKVKCPTQLKISYHVTRHSNEQAADDTHDPLLDNPGPGLRGRTGFPEAGASRIRTFRTRAKLSPVNGASSLSTIPSRADVSVFQKIIYIFMYWYTNRMHSQDLLISCARASPVTYATAVPRSLDVTAETDGNSPPPLKPPCCEPCNQSVDWQLRYPERRFGGTRHSAGSNHVNNPWRLCYGRQRTQVPHQ
ncbi:MAG: hypothetical protein HGB02_00935 [Chlorobiaceae bacterium]|nr:hypothetical protein [Chlorobiaceae bacterium]